MYHSICKEFVGICLHKIHFNGQFDNCFHEIREDVML